MIRGLTHENFLIYAIKNYDNPNCRGLHDFYEDLKRFKYLKRLFKRYEKTGRLNERLILNHLIILYNVFGPFATSMLFYKVEKKYWTYIKTFLVFLNYMPPEEFIELHLDSGIITALRRI